MFLTKEESFFVNALSHPPPFFVFLKGIYRPLPRRTEEKPTRFSVWGAREKMGCVEMFAALVECRDTEEREFVRCIGAVESVTVDMFRAAVVRAVRGCGASGSYNAVSKLGKGVCVRVSKVQFDDEQQAPIYWEMRCASQLGALDVGLPLLCFGIVTLNHRRRFVSCWPWVECASAFVARLDATERLRFGARLMCVVERALETCVHAESMKLSNVVVTRTAEIKLIDWDPRFTRYVWTDEQRAAASGMRVVYMLVLEGVSPGLFALEAVARAAGVSDTSSASSLVAAVAAKAAAALADVMRAFDASFASGLVQIVQLYLAFGARLKAHDPALYKSMRAVAHDDDKWADGLVGAGEADAHLHALLLASALVSFAPDAREAHREALLRVRRAHGASMRHATESVPDTDAEADLFCNETAVDSPAK